MKNKEELKQFIALSIKKNCLHYKEIEGKITLGESVKDYGNGGIDYVELLKESLIKSLMLCVCKVDFNKLYFDVARLKMMLDNVRYSLSSEMFQSLSDCFYEIEKELEKQKEWEGK